MVTLTLFDMDHLSVRLVQAGNCTAFCGSECTGDGAVGDLGSNGALHHTDCHSESSARAEGEETAPPRMEVRQGVQGVSLFVRGQKYEAVGSSFYQRHRSDPTCSPACAAITPVNRNRGGAVSSPFARGPGPASERFGMTISVVG